MSFHQLLVLLHGFTHTNAAATVASRQHISLNLTGLQGPPFGRSCFAPQDWGAECVVVGSKVLKSAVPAVVLVVGWVALGCPLSSWAARTDLWHCDSARWNVGCKEGSACEERWHAKMASKHGGLHQRCFRCTLAP